MGDVTNRRRSHPRGKQPPGMTPGLPAEWTGQEAGAGTAAGEHDGNRVCSAGRQPHREERVHPPGG